jgi:putative membrane protein
MSSPNAERTEWLSRPPREALAKTMGRAAWGLTAAVLVLVALMREVKIPLPAGVSFAFLPPFHAAVNALAAIVLVGALIAVKRGDIALHRKLIFGAMGLSVLFLLSYVAYHFTSNEVVYGDLDGNGELSQSERLAVAGSRGWYLVLLISHIVLAGVSLPFILFAFISGYTNRFASHRRLARWVFPVWLYVAVTGPICYWMLRPYYAI